MKSDLTRDTFDPAKQLSRVIMQQGRVALDADHNEQVAIFWHYLRALAEDVIGPHAAPAAAGGFELEVTDKSQVTISAGRYYVDGILVENDTMRAYGEQPHYPVADDDPLITLSGGEAATMFVYLDVWERHVTWIDDAGLREVALGGPDTCTRAQVVWQVRVAPFEASADGNADPECSTELKRLVPLSQATLTAALDPGETTDDLRVMPPESKYRGAENQLYRVEVHAPGDAGTATFKWSRDNGSVVTPLTTIDGNDLRVGSTRGFAAGDWVELTNDVLDLRGEPGLLLRLAKVEGDALSLDPADASITFDASAELHPKVRCWNQSSSEDIVLVDGGEQIHEPSEVQPNWIALEDGILVQFDDGPYRTGDYWLIPARVATGKLEWPSTDGNPAAMRARGIHHHYAPLGFVAWDGKALSVSESCRCTFGRIAVCADQQR